MDIKILGIGCPKCKRVEELAKQAAHQVGVEATFDHVTEMNKIMEYPILGTPGLVIEGKVVSSGRIPQVQEIVNWIKEAQSE